MRVRGKVFVVTGGGNGIGRQVVLALLAEGGQVAAADLSAEALQETERLAGPAAIRMTSHPVNVSDPDAVTALHDNVLAQHGHVDAIVNIAGVIHRFAHFAALTPDEEGRVMDVNFRGTVNMCRTFLPTLTSRPSAAIVNMSSLAALIPFAGQTFYGASKGAVKQFSEGLYSELLDTSVAVVTLFPGNISTNLAANSGVAMIDPKGQKVRSTTPEEAARAIVGGIRKGSFRVLVGADARMLYRLSRLSPRWVTRLVAKSMRSVL